MKYLLFFLALFPTLLFGQDNVQDYNQSIFKHREEYKGQFLKDARSPLQYKDLGNLRFYEPDESYRVPCTFKRTPDEKPFELPTYSGVTKSYRKYGVLTFELHGEQHSLAVYQSMKHIRMPQYKDYLFLPFQDLTNGETTYGGGRYLDLQVSDLESGNAVIDFNKCYNPWCGYSDGYSCPIPPTENHLNVAVHAGEKEFAGEHKHREANGN